MVRVCFVCLGNICRSPTAEAVFRALVRAEGLEAQVEIQSAGTSGWHVGERADPRSREAARRRGLELESRACQLHADDLARFDLVLAMDRDNLRTIERLAAKAGAGARARVALLRDFAPGAPSGRLEVPDPYFGEDGFDEVLDLCEEACRGLLEHLRETCGLGGTP